MRWQGGRTGGGIEDRRGMGGGRGQDQGWIMGLSVLLGPSLVLVADVLGRVVLRPGELPVGIVTAFIGAPVLVALARRKKVSGL